MVKLAMAAVNWRDYIVCDPAILCGKPSLKGTRLSVEFVLELLASGCTHEEMSKDYPSLNDERIRAVLACAANAFAEHKASIMPTGKSDDFDFGGTNVTTIEF